MNTIRLQNTDLKWYRDKYLTMVFVVCFLGGMSLLWAWPPPHQDLIRGTKFMVVAALCLLISPQRLMILAGGWRLYVSEGELVSFYIIQSRL